MAGSTKITYGSPYLAEGRAHIHRGQGRRALLAGLRACHAHPAQGDARDAVVGAHKEECGEHAGARVERHAAQDEAHHGGALEAGQMPCPFVELARGQAHDDGDGGGEEVGWRGDHQCDGPVVA